MHDIIHKQDEFSKCPLDDLIFVSEHNKSSINASMGRGGIASGLDDNLWHISHVIGDEFHSWQLPEALNIMLTMMMRIRKREGMQSVQNKIKDALNMTY